MVLSSVAGATVGDKVWQDTNGNGLQDAGEPGVNGVAIIPLLSPACPPPVDFG